MNPNCIVSGVLIKTFQQRVSKLCLNLDVFRLFSQPCYTDIADPAYMSLIHTRNGNRTYAELNLIQVNSGTTERPRALGYLEPAATSKYQNSLEMKTYTNS